MSFYKESEIKFYNFEFLDIHYNLEIEIDNGLIGTFYNTNNNSHEHAYQYEFKNQKELDVFLESLEIAGKIIKK